jgi:hypothetical protein
MRTYSIVLMFCLLLLQTAFSQSKTIFSGIPSIKISEGGVERTPETLSRERAIYVGCVISQIGAKYYWATRENKELIRSKTGAFITFVAVDGAGYIRTVSPEMKRAASLMGETEAKFDYVEHLLIGLKSITYYGNAQ